MFMFIIMRWRDSQLLLSLKPGVSPQLCSLSFVMASRFCFMSTFFDDITLWHHVRHTNKINNGEPPSKRPVTPYWAGTFLHTSMCHPRSSFRKPVTTIVQILRLSSQKHATACLWIVGIHCKKKQKENPQIQQASDNAVISLEHATGSLSWRVVSHWERLAFHCSGLVVSAASVQTTFLIH